MVRLYIVFGLIGLAFQGVEGQVALNCTFEVDLCGWGQASDDEFDWTRQLSNTQSPHTGPSFDHTIGINGYYMYIDNAGNRQNGDAARLESPDQTFPANEAKCLTFWYHMYGAHIGTLNVYLKSANTLGDILWSRKMTYGDEWLQAKVNMKFSSEMTGNVVIEATQGYRIHGDIAIDDVSLEDGICVMENAGCDFENGLCDGSLDNTGNFNWTLVTAGDTSVGPSLDKTYESSIGHYLLISATSENTDKFARFAISTMSLDSDRCLQFYYTFAGTVLGAMDVRIKVGDFYSHPVWSRFFQLGNGWNIGLVSLRQQSNFQVVFEVGRGKGQTGYIALDDIQVMDGDCPATDECNFEDGVCGFSNSVTGDDIDWVQLQGGTNTGKTGPSADHTTGLPTGTSLYLEGSNAASGATARMYSQIFSAELRSRCVEFWYSMYGSGMGTLSVALITPDNTNSPNTIWTLSGNQGNQWNYARIPFFSSKEYQLVFIGIVGPASSSDMAIDDIVISDGNCIGFPPGATVNPPSEGTTPMSGNPCGVGKFTCANGECINDSQYCNFVSECTDNSDEVSCPTTCIFAMDVDCGWYEGTPDDNFNWHIGSGYDTQITPDLAPRYDHTYNSQDGYYQYVAPVGVYVYPYESAEYYSPRFSTAASGCVLDFWWYQNGFRPYYFEVYLVENDIETQVFSYYATKGDQWNHLKLGIGRQVSPWQVKFNKLRYSNYMAATAIDDLKFKNCSWPPAETFCDTSTKFWCTTTKACIDKSFVCDLQDDCGDNSDEQNCESYTQCDFQDGTCDWTQVSGTDHLSWARAMGSTPTTYTGPSKDHTYSNTTGYYLYIEGYYNYYGRTAQIVSPIYEATTNGECKLRMFHHMYGQNIGKLTIYTRIYQNSNQGQTDVWHLIGENGPFWDRVDVTFSIDTDFQIVIEATAGDYYYGDIAIDDISLTPGCIKKTSGVLPAPPPTTPPPIQPSPTPHPSCQPSEFYCSADNRCLAAEFVCNFKDDCSDGEEEAARCVKPTCDFEDDTCGWLGVYGASSRTRREPDIPQFKWDRQQGRTRLPSEYRPPIDHTLGTGQGYYLFADNSPGQYYDTAIVKTPMIGATGADCHLQFYYHMGGTNVGSLQVLLLVGNTNSTLFSLSGVQGDDWKEANIYIGAGQGFQILFQGTRGSNYQGDECVDDVKFIDCAPPVLTGDPCLPTEFRCANSYCIDSDKVCNFVDECMDHSDEEHCDVQAGRCDFELDLCSWKQEASDDFDWSLSKGSTASIGTGPGNDHTTRSEKGHYIYIETSYPRVLGDRARLASPTIKGTTAKNNCKITFWYHMYGIDIGSLVVTMRKSYEGDNLFVMRNITGEQGNYWFYFSEVINSGGDDFKIVLEAMVGGSYRGDISVDDIIFSKECIAGGKLPGEDDSYQPPLEKCDDKPGHYKCDDDDGCFDHWDRCNFKTDCSNGYDEQDCAKSCDFESGQCGWMNSLSDSFNWTLSQGPSWTTYTGPNTDHTLDTELGHFMLFPADTPYTSTGNKAHIVTFPFQHSGDNCQLSFWYHMYGSYIGALNVFIKYSTHKSTVVWSKVGEQGDSWLNAVIDIGKQDEFRIIFEGVRGSGTYGDIGIDDIEFLNCADINFDRPCEDGSEFQCEGDSSCIPLDRYCDYRPDCEDSSDEKMCDVKPGDCHFDDSDPLNCDWIQYDDDDIDWAVAKASPNKNTGPDHDHTTVNTTGNSKFLYVNSQAGIVGQTARISTPKNAVFPASNGLCVLRFWFHMYAVNENGVGGLRVYTESDVTTEQRSLFWHVFGNQGNQWNYAKVVIGNLHAYKVVFEAIMGSPNSSDIAVDDVTFTESCYNPENSTNPFPGSCPRNQFYCVGDNICIPNSWLNDGTVDCPTNCFDEYLIDCDSKQPQIGDKGTNVGVIVGGVIGGLVLAALIVLLVFVIIKCCRNKTGATYMFNFGFNSSKSDDKVRMSDVDIDIHVPPQTGGEPFSLENPVYSGKSGTDSSS